MYQLPPEIIAYINSYIRPVHPIANIMKTMIKEYREDVESGYIDSEEEHPYYYDFFTAYPYFYDGIVVRKFKRGRLYNGRLHSW